MYKRSRVYPTKYVLVLVNEIVYLLHSNRFFFKKFTASNFAKLYGFHEQYLNRLYLKYSQKSIKDFYT